MTQSQTSLQMTLLFLSLAALTVTISASPVDLRSRFRDAPMVQAPIVSQDVALARGLRQSGQGAIDPLDVQASRARN